MFQNRCSAARKPGRLCAPGPRDALGQVGSHRLLQPGACRRPRTGPSPRTQGEQWRGRVQTTALGLRSEAHACPHLCPHYFPVSPGGRTRLFVPLVPRLAVTFESLSVLLCSRTVRSMRTGSRGCRGHVFGGWGVPVASQGSVPQPAFLMPWTMGRGDRHTAGPPRRGWGSPLTDAASPGRRGRTASSWSGVCALPPWAGWGP